MRAARPSCGGNMVNTRGNLWHDRHVDDHLVYSPYKWCHPLAFAGGGDTLVAAAVLTTCTVS